MRNKIIDKAWMRRPVGADARLRPWLLDRGSLTRRIQLRSRRFGVRLLALSRAPATRDECHLVEVAAHRFCAVREVVLVSDDAAVVFAHSTAARRALHGPWRLLLTLGTRPLGAALFADPRVARQPLRFRQVRRGHALYDKACGQLAAAPASLWARRSLFVFRGSRLLVTEVFLPAILALAP
jgi:chorismate--pyruvate lyase